MSYVSINNVFCSHYYPIVSYLNGVPLFTLARPLCFKWKYHTYFKC